MRPITKSVCAPICSVMVAALAIAQTPTRPGAQIPAKALYNLQDAFLEWPLPPQDKAYGAIDGKRIHTYVEDLTAISRKYRDNGHPQFWGRIIGTQADADTARWLLD